LLEFVGVCKLLEEEMAGDGMGGDERGQDG